MISRLRKHTVSFKHAFDGLVHNVKTQPNFRFHLLAMISVCLMGVYFNLSWVEWLILIFTFNMVIVAEMVNTAIEAMVDLISLEWRKDAHVAKDVSAAMVLVAAIFSILIGLYIFLPKIITN